MSNILIYGKDVYLRKAIRKKIDGDSSGIKENFDSSDYKTLEKFISKNQNYVVLFILEGNELDIPQLLAPITSSLTEVICLVPRNKNLIQTLTYYNYRFIKLPLKINELQKELSIIKEHREKKFSGEGYYNINEKHETHSSWTNKEDFPYKKGIIMVNPDTIIGVDASDKKSILKFFGRIPLLVNLSLKKTMLKLNKYDIFQANRSQAINFNEVSEVQYSYGGCFTTTNHLEVFVSKKYRGILPQYNLFVANHRRQ